MTKQNNDNLVKSSLVSRSISSLRGDSASNLTGNVTNKDNDAMEIDAELQELTSGLTDEQTEAVLADPTGSLRISAGAGSGKTEVLTRRIVAMLKKGVSPDELVAITYTQKAASEMKTRLIEKRKVPQHIMRKMDVATFHAFLSNILKKDPFGAGLDKGDTVVNETSRQLILTGIQEKFSKTYGEQIINGEHKLGQKNASKIISSLPRALNKIRRYILSPSDFFKHAKERFANRKDEVTELEQNTLVWLMKYFHMYLQDLKDTHLYDFDSILIQGKKLVQHMIAEGVLPKQNVFLIDEFQDNNKEQFDIVKLFMQGEEGHITVVGDEKQSIYSFQGADVQNFRDFVSDTDVILKDNFRSYKEILMLSDAYLKVGNAEGEMFVEQLARLDASPRELPIACMYSEANDIKKDAVEIVAMIKAMVDRKLLLQKNKRAVKYGDIAIIAPSIKALPADLEDALLANHIPYVMSGGLGFYDRGEINDILAFLKLLANPQDNHAAVKILTSPLYGLNDSELVRLSMLGKNTDVSLLAIILSSNEEDIPSKARQFRQLFTDLKSKSPKLGILDLCHTIIEKSGFFEYAATQNSELKQRRTENNIAKFLTIVRNFEQSGIFTTIRDFLKYVENILNSGIEENEAGLGLEDGDAIKIMTIHKSKGLEFPIVICPFLKSHDYRKTGNIFFTKEHGLMVNTESKSKIPEGTTLSDYFESEKEASVAENRRKLYVAFTRAEELLILTGGYKNCFPTDGKTRKEEPLRDIREILEATPEIGKTYKLEEWPELIEHWLSFGKAELPEEVEELEATDEIEIEELKNNINTVYNFVCSDSLQIEKEDNSEEIYSLQDMNLFRSCPRKFFFTRQHIQSFKEKVQSPFAIAGTIIHETIRLFHSRNGHSLEISARYELVKEIIHTIAPLYGEHGIASQERALNVMEHYIKSTLGETKPFLAEAEINVKFNTETAPFFMRGFIDRVDKKDDETTHIIDFKTRHYSPDSHSQYEKQAALYLIASQRGILGKLGHFNITEASIAYLSESRLEIIPIEPDIHKFEEEAVKFVEAVRAETEWLPCDGSLCSECGFSILCNEVITQNASAERKAENQIESESEFESRLESDKEAETDTNAKAEIKTKAEVETDEFTQPELKEELDK